MIGPLDEGLCARDRVMQILVRPEHLALVQLGRIEQVEIHRRDLAAPARTLDRPAFSMMGEQPLPGAVAVIVEGDQAVGDIDMRAGETLGGSDPLCPKSLHRRISKKDARQDVAGAVTEEDPIGQRPPSDRVFLDAVLQDVHTGKIG